MRYGLSGRGATAEQVVSVARLTHWRLRGYYRIRYTPALPVSFG
jgi:hypothetical protein